jgi:phosphate transport system permease protein
MPEPTEKNLEAGSVSKAPPAGTPLRKPRGDRFWLRGEPMVWLTGGSLAAILLGAMTILIVILCNGLAYFWPARLEELQLSDSRCLLGRRLGSVSEGTNHKDFAFRTANKGFDLTTQAVERIQYGDVLASDYPPDAVAVERSENSDFYGTLAEVQATDLGLPDNAGSMDQLHEALRAMAARRALELDPLLKRIATVSEHRSSAADSQSKLIYRKKVLAESQSPDQNDLAVLTAKIDEWQAEIDGLDEESKQLVAERLQLEAQLRKNVAVFRTSDGKRRSIALVDIVRVYQPNSMGFLAKLGHYLTKVWELLATPPRESNTEGGLLPALFGTMTLVFLMAIFCFPLGVLAGTYLGEYAHDGLLVRLVRIGVNNLAGIPSIVYGIFGVGFFINYLGAHIDQGFFPHLAGKEPPQPVFGTGGVLWASLTLGLLTVPVVIVATEEAIRVIPRSVRESSFALGATKFQTLVRVVLPLASPGILTGFILAIARAAGEVAPLMMTGVVSSAPTLPLDGTFPYFHLERQFMHLGFQIYSVAFQSPDAEAARPLVYVIALLLVLIVLALSGAAIVLRNRMRKTLQIRAI